MTMAAATTWVSMSVSFVAVVASAVTSGTNESAVRTSVVTTIALTLLSFVPDLLADAHVSTRLTLALTHVVAAAIVIPALASRLAEGVHR